MTPKGRALSKEKGGGFIAQSWLENDGDAALQADAFARAAFQGPKGSVAASFGDRKVWVFAGKGSAARAAPACKEGALVILSEDWGSADGKGCLILDRRALRRTGALALYGQTGNNVFVSAREWAGKRLWNYRPRRKPQPTSDPVQAGAMKG
jgi:competence protein ComEC